MPQVLNYSTGGMIYGAKLLDATQGLRIDDPVYATNLNEHFKQCVFYDILLGRKTYDDTLKSSDLLTAMGPGSVALSQQYIYPDGTSGIVTRSEEHTSELQSLMRISYAVFCLQKTTHSIHYL